MPIGITLQVKGLTQLRKEYKALGSKKLDASMARSGTRAVKEVVVPGMRMIAPVLSGRLKATIRAGKDGQVLYGKAPRVPYAGVINFGWADRNIEAQEIMYSTIDENREEIVSIYEEDLEALLKRTFPRG